jgi:Mn2+/Fe2+ NRAMP family transporter
MQLFFAIIPLIHFTNDRERMGPFANAPWVGYSPDHGRRDLV